MTGNRQALCGGTIIDSTTIITAGHCVYDSDTGQTKLPSDTYVYFGTVSSVSQNYIQPTQITLHPDYNPHDFRNDIAMLRVPPLNLSKGKVESIAIFNNNIAPKQAMEIYGWGTTKSHGTYSDTPPSLLTQTVYVSEPKACQIIEPRYDNANEYQICTDANYNVGVDACQGDSGTGSTIKYNGIQYFAGLVSYGTDRYGSATCGEPNSFGMYTRVSHYLSWIKSLGGTYELSPSDDSTSTTKPSPSIDNPPDNPKSTSTCYLYFICI
ncbi:trypsin-like serine protease [Coemansia reversa NRRL 1564]|uniref:Trypsin-like serine protease n=1 Tax=Coemansia reversa (strain ATCC 12441 / NRRL 1564) TaxID=763665 RepID=A0A2G5BBM1_COERN|nr:trypsin-like serine protease [Coemansia reversa NRRL 1564]|eukprot:PIA16414.1 trypsin-like serine protease [Coemansia reversa NRRL 1564]